MSGRDPLEGAIVGRVLGLWQYRVVVEVEPVSLAVCFSQPGGRYPPSGDWLLEPC